MECVEGLRAPDRGEISVLGLDPQRDRAELTERLGVQLQESRLPDQLRVAEALELYSSFYRDPADWRELMEVLGSRPRPGPPSASVPRPCQARRGARRRNLRLEYPSEASNRLGLCRNSGKSFSVS